MRSVAAVRYSLHTPSTAFRHLAPRKDVVNQCLEFVVCLMRAGVVAGVVGFGVVVAGMVSVVRVVARGVTGAVGAEAAREAMVTIRVILARQIGRVAPRIRIGRVVVGAGVWNTYVTAAFSN